MWRCVNDTDFSAVLNTTEKQITEEEGQEVGG